MRRIICLALFVFAGLHFTSMATAQTDDSFERWPNSCKSGLFIDRDPEKCKAAEAEAAERGISVEQALAEAEAAERGISVEELSALRTSLREAAQAKYEKERAEAETRDAIMLAVAATVSIALAVVLIKTRLRIATSLSRRWRKRSKDFRVWAFSSFFWILGTFLYVWLDEPYGSRMNDFQIRHMLGLTIGPPLFFGALWFGYKRFVK